MSMVMQMNERKMGRRTKAALMIIGLIVLGIIVGYVVSTVTLSVLKEKIQSLPIQVDQIRVARSLDYYTGAVIILTVDLVILCGVLYTYLDSYRKTKSRFLMVLNVFIMALIIKSVLSLVSLYSIATEYIAVIPYVSRTFLTPGFGDLNFIVIGFEIFAGCLLVYLSME